jgi:hypothetical protein
MNQMFTKIRGAIILKKTKQTKTLLNLIKNSGFCDILTWPTPIPVSAEIQFKTVIRYHSPVLECL